MKEETDNLLARYFGGNASEQDMQALEHWISASTENQEYFDEMTKLYAKLGGFDSTLLKPDTLKAKKTFRAYMSMHDNKPQQVSESVHRPFYESRMFKAASILLIFALSFSFWFIYTSEHDVVLSTQMALKQDVLPDQTQIKLSRNSKITYSSKYGKRNRIIRLEGKAYFAVGHNGNGTLQINAAETLIEDVGTRFTVSAYPDSLNIRVSVHEGKVHFFTASDNGINLKATETGIYNKKTKSFSVQKAPEDTISREIKHVRFSGNTLQDAMNTIAKMYSVVIRFDEKSIGKRKITADFDGENVDMVLQVIAETLDLSVKKDAGGYLLSNNKKPTK